MFSLVALRWSSEIKNVTVLSGLYHVFFVLLFSVLLVFYTASRTEIGFRNFAQWLSLSSDVISSLAPDGETSVPDFDTPPNPDENNASSSAQSVIEALTPQRVDFIEWMYRLQNSVVATEPMTVYINQPQALSARQQRIFSYQGIDIQPWSEQNPPPARNDNVLEQNKVWIYYFPNGSFRIHGTMSFLMKTHSNKNDNISNFDILRVILLSDELVLQEQWRRDNPAPEPPEELRLSYVDLSLIPSNVTFLEISSFLMVFIVLAFSALSLNLNVIEWREKQKEGIFEVFAPLPFKTLDLLLSYILFWTSRFFVLLLFSSMIVVLFSMSIDVPVSLWSVLAITCSSAFFSFILTSLGLMISSWFSSRAWQVWCFLLISLVSLAAQAFILSLATSLSFATIFSGAHDLKIMAVCVVLALATAKILNITAGRLDRLGRSGFKKI